MRKIILSIAIVLSLNSCTPPPIQTMENPCTWILLSTKPTQPSDNVPQDSVSTVKNSCTGQLKKMYH